MPAAPRAKKDKSFWETVKLAENTLGWIPTESGPLHKGYAAACGILNRAAEKDPRVTPDNLALVITLLRSKRESITSIRALVAYLDEALERAAEADKAGDDLDGQIKAALAWEQDAQRSDKDRWVRRLNRSVGEGRAETLAEWRTARGL